MTIHLTTFIVSLISFGMIGFIVGQWSTRILIKRIPEDYEEDATGLWVAATMVVTGAESQGKYMLVFKSDFEEMELALKDMESTMQRYETVK